jgi:SAM-dependent methyltransferase
MRLKGGKVLIDRSLNYGRHIIVQYIKSALPFQKVLDIGAGIGMDLDSVKQVNPQCELFGVDANRLNTEKLRSQGVTTQYLDIERESLPFDDEEMDLVIANQILEHIKEIFWIFHEMSRVIKTGGKLVIGVPNLASLHNRILLTFGRQPSSIKTISAHVRGFTKSDLLSFIEICFPAGYFLDDFAGSNFYPFPSFFARPLSRIFPNMSWGIFFFLKKVRKYHSQFLDYPARHQLETNYWLGPVRV